MQSTKIWKKNLAWGIGTVAIVLVFVATFFILAGSVAYGASKGPKGANVGGSPAVSKAVFRGSPAQQLGPVKTNANFSPITNQGFQRPQGDPKIPQPSNLQSFGGGRSKSFHNIKQPPGAQPINPSFGGKPPQGTTASGRGTQGPSISGISGGSSPKSSPKVSPTDAGMILGSAALGVTAGATLAPNKSGSDCKDGKCSGDGKPGHGKSPSGIAGTGIAKQQQGQQQDQKQKQQQQQQTKASADSDAAVCGSGNSNIDFKSDPPTAKSIAKSGDVKGTFTGGSQFQQGGDQVVSVSPVITFPGGAFGQQQGQQQAGVNGTGIFAPNYNGPVTVIGKSGGDDFPWWWGLLSGWQNGGGQTINCGGGACPAYAYAEPYYQEYPLIYETPRREVIRYAEVRQTMTDAASVPVIRRCGCDLLTCGKKKKGRVYYPWADGSCTVKEIKCRAIEDFNAVEHMEVLLEIVDSDRVPYCKEKLKAYLLKDRPAVYVPDCGGRLFEINRKQWKQGWELYSSEKPEARKVRTVQLQLAY